MTAIWQHDGVGWSLLSPAGFPDEATLHSLVEQAPHTLPLAGSPQLTILGREVPLGGSYADLIAIEQSGRLAIIEIKLAKSPEARRAVIAQILTYAAYLRGLDVITLERDVLGKGLKKRGYETIAQAASADGQHGSFDADAFERELAEGRFRLVLVLDDAPAELVRLVGYLGAVADKLLIDLVTVTAYEIAGTQVIVPQRVDPETPTEKRIDPLQPLSIDGGRLVPGAADFTAAIEEAPESQRAFLRRLTEWAEELDRAGLINLSTYYAKKGMLTLLPRVRVYGSGLVTIYNGRSPNGAYLQFWRSVIEKLAPKSLQKIEQLAEPAKVGNGTVSRDVSDELLAALTDAYREAATGRVNIDPIIRVDDVAVERLQHIIQSSTAAEPIAEGEAEGRTPLTVRPHEQ